MTDRETIDHWFGDPSFDDQPSMDIINPRRKGMRYIVKYNKPGQIQGARVFDIPKDSNPEAVREAAEKVAGPGATIVDVYPNDQSPLGETVGA